MTRAPRPLVLLVALLSLHALPGAAAGTEAEPEVRDPSGDASPAYDLEVAWFEATRDGVRFTLRIQQAAQPQRDVLYYAAFTVEGKRWLAGVGYDDDGRLHTYLGAPNVGVGGQGPEMFANGGLEQARHQPGRPTYISAVVPYDSIDGLDSGARMENLSAGVDRVVRGRTWLVEDLQNTDSSYTVEAVGLAALLPRAREGAGGAAPVMLGGLAVAAAVAGGAYAYARRSGRLDEAPPAAPTPGAAAAQTDRADPAEKDAPGAAADARPDARADAPPDTSRGPRRLRLDPRDLE